MSIRYTMDGASEAYFDGGDPHNLNNLNLRSEYEIVTNNESVCGDGCYNGSSDCSYCTAMKNANIATTKAGFKIFTIVMLHAWRMRRSEIKKLKHSIEELKKETLRTKNQLHVYSSLIRVEQKRNVELTTQLKRTLNNLKLTTSSHESMTTNMISLKAEKSLLEQELKIKYEEYDAVHSVLAQTKTDLFRSMMEQRNLQSQLCNMQRMVQSLESQKIQLTNEVASAFQELISDINTKHQKVEENFIRQLEEKDFHIYETKTKLANLEAKYVSLQKKITTEERDKSASKEVQLLRLQVAALQGNVESSLSFRLRLFWKQFIKYQHSTFRQIHILAFYLLPATPPPTKFIYKGKATRSCLQM